VLAPRLQQKLIRPGVILAFTQSDRGKRLIEFGCGQQVAAAQADKKLLFAPADSLTLYG